MITSQKIKLSTIKNYEQFFGTLRRAHMYISSLQFHTKLQLSDWESNN